MSAVSRTTATAGVGAPRKTYITMRPYYNDFFSYTTSVSNYLTTGTLSVVVGASATPGQPGYCAQGAFLRETGRRIYPGANPGVATLMVSVFDFATGLTGFIDPNSFAFTPQNSDRSYYIDSAGYNPNSSDSPLQSDQGPPVYTHGDVLADGDMYIGGTASTIGNAYFASNVSTVGNVAVGGNESILGSLAVKGEVKLFSPTTVGTTAMDSAIDTYSGGFQRHAVSSVNYNNTTSRVFLTPKGQGNPSLLPFYSVEATSLTNVGGLIAYAPSTFYIVSRQVSTFAGSTPVAPPTGNDTTTFNYLIVNQS